MKSLLITNLLKITLVSLVVLFSLASYNPAAPKPVVKDIEKPAVLSEVTTDTTPILPPLPIQLPLPIIPLPQSPTTPPPPSEASQIQFQADAAVTDLENNDATAFFNLLSSDLTSTYSESDIDAALSSTGQQITAVRNLGDPNITGDYADQNVEVTTSTGTYRFQVFLHKESGTWKLMGTEPLP